LTENSGVIAGTQVINGSQKNPQWLNALTNLITSVERTRIQETGPHHLILQFQSRHFERQSFGSMNEVMRSE